MKLHGVEGMSPEDIRNEVNRGGKLVIYTYCVSFVVLTLKRPTDIRLVRAGHSPVTAGLSFTFISLLFGWWGFPWGPIYTIETIYRNLTGGIDVTHDVLRSIAPAAPATPAAASLHAPTPAPLAPVSPKRGPNLKTIALMAGVASFMAALGVTIYCYQQQQHLKVALVSGLDQAYTVKLNGKSYPLAAHGYRMLELPEGDFTLEDDQGGHVVGSTKNLHFSVPFFDHVSTDKMAVINPDSIAVIYNEQVTYYKDGTAPTTPTDAEFTLFANQPAYFIDRPDYAMEPTPERVSMPSGTSVLAKTRLDYIRENTLGGVLDTLKTKLGYPAVVDHFRLLARQRTDEPVLRAAMQNLKKEDWPAFFRTHLADRPVLIEWHRYYQRAMEYTHPDADLFAEYRNYLQAEPTNGALLYLTGRATSDRTESHQLWQKALSVEPPCGYASAAFGFDAFVDGEFEQADQYYNACEKTGTSSESLAYYRQKTNWALRRFDKILENVRVARQKAPLSVELADTEISALLEAGPDASAALKAKNAFVAAAAAAHFSKADLDATKAYLDAHIAYQTGRLPAYFEALKQLDAPAYRFDAAITRGDLKAAETASHELSDPSSTSFLLLYMLAKQTGDEAAADRHFAAAVAAMGGDRRETREAARLLSATSVPVGEICHLSLDVEEKCILLTALGLRDPANRSTYYALAAKLNFTPTFPQRFLNDIHRL